MDLKIILIGGEKELAFVEKRIRYPQLISAKYIWNEELFQKEPADFLLGIDVVVLAFEQESVAARISEIIRLSNTEDTIVIDFYSLRYRLASKMKADFIMRNPVNDHYDGLVFGISHSEVGIIPQRLGNGIYANLAVGSQDLYYNYKTLEYCLSCYPDKIRSLRTVILDMYDYSYFNYDVSLSAQLPQYLGFGGYNKDQHNFIDNKNYKSITFNEIVNLALSEHIQGVTEEMVDVWEMMFGPDVYSCFECMEHNLLNFKYRIEVVSDEKCNEFRLKSIAEKVFERTVTENISVIRNFFELLTTINPDIKVYLVTIPRFEGVWNKEEIMVRNWKDRFIDIISQLQKDYRFEYLDLSRHEIATCRYYYHDHSHFNIYGAMRFTDMLNDIMKAH